MEGDKFPCPLAEELECDSTFSRKQDATRHVNQVHSRHFPCPRAGDLNCRKKFHSEDAANDHATSAHDEREPCPCPRADDLECKETFYSKTSAQRHANEAHKGIKWACPRAEELDCQLMFDSKMKARQHSQRDHERVKWPCPHASELDCDKMFISERNANIHAEGVHNPSRWPCPHADDLNCPNTYAFQKDAIKHGKYAHETEIVEWPCPLAEEEGCDVTFRSKRIAQMHAKVIHSDKETRKRFPCSLANEFNCKKTFSLKGNAKLHSRNAHEKLKWPCPFAKEGCTKDFTTKNGAAVHATRFHTDEGPSSSLRKAEGFPCPSATVFDCDRTFATSRHAERHNREMHEGAEWPCPLADEEECTLKFTNESNSIRHARTMHGFKKRVKPCPCPRAKEENCPKTFSSRRAAKDHAIAKHGKFQPDQSFIAAWPRISLDIPLRDVDGEVIPDNIPQPSFMDGKWTCPHAGCTTTYLSLRRTTNHYLSAHKGAHWPCQHAEQFGCEQTFVTIYEAKQHVDQHFARPKWVCQYPRCLSQIQGRKQSQFHALSHYKLHVKRGQIQDGQCKPLLVLSSLPGDNVGTEDEVGDSEDEKDGDGEDSESESEDDELDESVGAEPTAEAAAAWLGSPPKKQNILREAAQSDGLIHLGLKCPGPERVVDGLVIGTQVCPHNAIISFETGTFYKDRLRDRVGLKARCAPCNGRFMFNEFLRVRFLEAGADQKTCHYKSCVGVLWEGSKLCQKHFLAWKPGLPGEDDMKKMKSLFDQATSVQWYPETKVMADIIRRIESDNKAKIPASEVVNIDLEFSFYSQAVLQVGLADLAGNKVLDCLTQYGEGIIAPSSSRLSAPATWRQQNHAAKVKRYYTQDGKLNAKRVVEKLREANISQDTKFMSWASWGFDLSFLRDWLDDEGFSDVLPGDENLCLLYHEFRVNIKRVLGTNCYGGKSFPLSLPTFYPVIFGTNDPLSGRNHHAFVDSQQLSRLTNLFVDLCKPPNKRGGIETLRLRKRQRGLEEYLPNLSIHNKRAKGS